VGPSLCLCGFRALRLSFEDHVVKFEITTLPPSSHLIPRKSFLQNTTWFILLYHCTMVSFFMVSPSLNTDHKDITTWLAFPAPITTYTFPFWLHGRAFSKRQSCRHLTFRLSGKLGSYYRPCSHSLNVYMVTPSPQQYHVLNNSPIQGFPFKIHWHIHKFPVR